MLFNKFGKLSSNKELVIVLLVIVVLALMIIPIPTELMDFIIACNIGITIVVLMVVIYMDSTLKLTSFPSILLILALLRIGITISTSRLILLNGDAGEIVSTFGEFVVGGNLVVGVIIFIIITIINFIVITKGSERVAEVAARFSLDAMPGKQMSIDSDLRANTIDMHEATSRRAELNLESKLYGAMDGAMKFVKGDAIASIIDIIINLIGGLIIGMVQHNLDFSEALHTYSILTVGDGLVQQIPAILISLTAGIMITRVNDEKKGLGDSILGQLFNNPKALLASSAMLVIMSFVPGMPRQIFIGLFIVMVIGVILIKRFQGKVQTKDTKTETIIEEEGNPVNEASSEQFESWKLAPLSLYISSNLKDAEYVKNIKTALINVKNEILMDLGVEIPNIILRYNANLDKNTYQLLVHEIPASTATLYTDHILLLDSDRETLDALGVTDGTENQADIGRLNKGYWISQDFKTKCDEYKLPYMSNDNFITLHVKHAVNKHVADFLGMQEVKNLLDKINEYQDLIKDLIRILPLNKLTEVLQRLISEGISIRNFKVILDALLEWGQMEKDVIIITEQVRKSLGRYIAYKFSKGTYSIPCFLLEQEFEDMVRDSIRFTNNGSYLALDPEVTNQFLEKLLEMYNMHNCSKMAIAPVILTQLDIRRYVRSLIEKNLPYIYVLSFQELDGHTEFSGLGVVEVG